MRAPHTHTWTVPTLHSPRQSSPDPPPVWHVNGCTAQRTNPVKESKAPQASGGKQQESVRGSAPPGTALCPARATGHAFPSTTHTCTHAR